MSVKTDFNFVSPILTSQFLLHQSFVVFKMFLDASKQFLLFLVITFSVVNQVTSTTPTYCSNDSDCGSFAVCYVGSCRCRLGAKLANEKNDKVGCDMTECSTNSDCYLNFVSTVCDNASHLCVCKSGYSHNPKTQKCDYNIGGSGSGSSFDCGIGFMWRWLGPLVAFTMLFPIAILFMRFFMMRQMVKSSHEQMLMSRIVVMPGSNGQNIGPNNGQLYPVIPPPAYSPARNYPQTQQQN